MEDLKTADAFFRKLRDLDLKRLESELQVLRGYNFKDAMEIRGPYSPRYCKAESAKACAEYIVKEYLTFIDQYNLYNRDTAFMQTYLETPALGSGHKIQSVRAKLIYQAGEVLMEYKRELARFLEAAQLWSDHTKVEAKERSVFRRIIPRGDDWYTTY